MLNLVIGYPKYSLKYTLVKWSLLLILTISYKVIDSDNWFSHFSSDLLRKPMIAFNPSVYNMFFLVRL